MPLVCRSSPRAAAAGLKRPKSFELGHVTEGEKFLRVTVAAAEEVLAARKMKGAEPTLCNRDVLPPPDNDVVEKDVEVEEVADKNVGGVPGDGDEEEDGIPPKLDKAETESSGGNMTPPDDDVVEKDVEVEEIANKKNGEVPGDGDEEEDGVPPNWTKRRRNHRGAI